jgi:hypothetical protein
MGDRCEKCEQVAAELRAELRAEFNRRIDEIFDRISAAVAQIEGRGLGLIANIDHRTQHLLDRFAERLLLPPQRIDEEPPKPHYAALVDVSS